MLRDTVDSIKSRDRWLLAQLSEPAGTLPASFHRCDTVASYRRFSPHLFSASSLRFRIVLRPTERNKTLAIGILGYLGTFFRLDRFAVADASVYSP